MAKSEKLDRIIDGTRYRSSRRISLGGRQDSGVRDVALWFCRRVAVLEGYSIWDRGDGICVGETYQVVDPREVEGRVWLQSIADGLSGDEAAAVLAMARAHAPGEQ